MTPTQRRVTVVDNRPFARMIGERIRQARTHAGLTQAAVARGRYTPAYISALERGHAKPSMAALSFIAERLGRPMHELIPQDRSIAQRVEADLLLASSRYAEALDSYDELLGEVSDGRRRAEVQRARAETLCRLGRGGAAIAPATEAAEFFAGIGSKADAAWASYWLAFAQYQVDNTDEARSILSALLAAERSGLNVSADFRFRLLTSLGQVEAWAGNTERAISYMEEARALTADLSLRQRAAFLSGLALQYLEAGDLERAIRAGTESLALYHAAEAQPEEAALENNLALTYLQLGNLARAGDHVRRARELTDTLADPRLDSEIADTEAQLAWSHDDRERAEERVAVALNMVQHGGSSLAASSAYLTRARMARERGELAAAAASYAAAADLLRVRGPRPRLRDVLAEWAELLTAAGDHVGATRLYAEALGRSAPAGAR